MKSHVSPPPGCDGGTQHNLMHAEETHSQDTTHHSSKSSLEFGSLARPKKKGEAGMDDGGSSVMETGSMTV